VLGVEGISFVRRAAASDKNQQLHHPMPESISTIKDDISNITAPSFLLAERSTIELPAYCPEQLPSYWLRQPSMIFKTVFADLTLVSGNFEGTDTRA